MVATQTFQSGFRTTLALICNPSDTTMTLATVPTVTAGRLYLSDGLQEEWVSYTGVSGSTVTGLTRGLSKTADPATSGTGLTWIAGTKVKLVAMHDQLADKQQGNQFLGSAQVYATTAARDSALGADGVATKAYSDVYVTATGLHYQYNLSSNQWEAIETGTVTPNASTTVAGKVEEATPAQVGASTGTGETGARLFVNPTSVVKTSGGAADENKLPLLNSVGQLDQGFVNYVDTTGVGDGSDGDVVITTTITLTRDMFYNNLTITSPGILIPDGYRIYVYGTLSGNGKIQRNGNNGANAGAAPAAGAGATALNTGTLNADIAGSNGGVGSTGAGNGTAGVDGTATNPSYSNTTGAAGGVGADYGNTPGAGGAGGASTRGALYNVGSMQNYFRMIGPASLFENTTQYKGIGGSGGGGGGSGTVGNGGGGGGGGGNGGFIRIAVNTINRTGTFESIGGTGGNGGNATGSQHGGGGGGAGGSGGVVILFCKTATSVGSSTLTGGTGGTVGTSIGAAQAPGANGANGSSGVFIQVAL